MEIELHAAFFWDCPECGRENFVRGVKPEFSASELAELRDEHGINPWETGSFLLRPNDVKCCHCNEKFAVLYHEDVQD